ncbi:hypothetical protein BsWGS_25298 [Bradybaena similaris]
MPVKDDPTATIPCASPTAKAVSSSPAQRAACTSGFVPTQVTRSKGSPHKPGRSTTRSSSGVIASRPSAPVAWTSRL